MFTRTYCCQLIGVVILEGADGQLTLDGDAAGRRCEIAASASKYRLRWEVEVGRVGERDLTDPGQGTHPRDFALLGIGEKTGRRWRA